MSLDLYGLLRNLDLLKQALLDAMLLEVVEVAGRSVALTLQ